jgi:hypothetical protein
MLEHYGENAGLRIGRKHIGWYSKGLPQSAEFRSSVNNAETAVHARDLIDTFFQKLLSRSDEQIAADLRASQHLMTDRSEPTDQEAMA